MLCTEDNGDDNAYYKEDDFFENFINNLLELNFCANRGEGAFLFYWLAVIPS